MHYSGKIKKSLLVIAGFTSFSMNASETINTNNDDKNSFKSTPFIKDSHLDLTLQNVYMINTTDQLSEMGIGNQEAWAQALHLDYRSGLLLDSFGVDASWYGVMKLYANDDFGGRDLLRDNGGHAEGFNKLGQIYAKAEFGDKNRYINSYAGWKQMYKFGVLNTSRSRATPTTWEGISTEMAYDQLRTRLAVVTRFSERDEPEKRRFLTLKSKKQIDYIATGDIRWQWEKDKSLLYYAGESKDYILRQGLEANWLFDLPSGDKIITRGVAYYNKGLSEWEGYRGYTDHASHYMGLLGYRTGDIEFGGAYSKTRAKLDNGLGHFYWHLGKNTRGTFNSPADGEGNDYINDGEQMLYGFVQYKITPELLTGLYGNYGYGVKYKNVSLKEWEYGGFTSYSPKAIEGLNIFVGFGPAYGWKYDKRNQPNLTADGNDYHHAKGVAGGLRIEYKTNLF